MMMLSLSLAVSVCVVMVAVEGLPSSRYNPFTTNDPSNNNPQPHRDEELIDDDDNGAMQSQEYDTNDGFNSRQIAFISAYDNIFKAKRDKFPYIAIGQLVTNSGDVNSVCSGAFIHEKVFLTAAHCLYDHDKDQPETPAIEILQKKGCDGGSTGTVHHRPDPKKPSYIPANWKNNQNYDYDYALVFIKKTSGKIMNMKVVTVNALVNTNVRIVGYPEEDNAKDCMMESAGTVQGPEPNYNSRFYYDCDASLGMSGGPVRDEKDNIIGIHSALINDNDPFNNGVAMTRAVFDDIKEHLPTK